MKTDFVALEHDISAFADMQRGRIEEISTNLKYCFLSIMERGSQLEFD